MINNVDDAYTNTAIQNTWNPRLNRGPSDFDTRSQINADWVYALPVGHGKQFLSSSSRAVDAVVGGWQISGLNRWTSGLPFTLESPAFPTNYDNPGMAIITAPVPTHREIVNGVPREFTTAETTLISNGFYGGTAALPTPMRLPYAGEAGERNNFRGDGVFDLDMAVSKSWALWEGVKLKFAAEAYNLTNSVRFDVSPNGLAAGLANPNLGIYSQPLSTYRRMQFGLRLDF